MALAIAASSASHGSSLPPLPAFSSKQAVSVTSDVQCERLGLLKKRVALQVLPCLRLVTASDVVSGFLDRRFSILSNHGRPQVLTTPQAVSARLNPAVRAPPPREGVR